jgi:TrmH family RNA methyltransferase
VAEHGRTGGVVHELFVTDAAAERHTDLVNTATRLGLTVHRVSEAVADAVSSTRTPQGVVAVCAIPNHTMADVLANMPTLVAVLAHVADPGNAGTAIRTADAAGADAVVLTGDGVDPYNGKCVRASAGSLFHLPVVAGVTVQHAVETLRQQQLTVLAADANGAVDLDAMVDGDRLVGPTAWLFGNEAHGLDEATRQAADETVRVPIRGRAESLNLAAAVAVCLYASARAQRR